ncbi:MAG: ABC transporter ATP-binding protein, partial [Gemmatimonadota bacterium]
IMLLEVRGLRMQRGGQEVLAGLDFTADRGEIYGLLGPNGAGKTTCFDILAGFLVPDAGEIRLAGRPLDGEARRTVGIVPQEIALYPKLTCRQNLRFFARLYGVRSVAVDARVAASLRDVGLAASADRPVAQLSGGMQRRLNVAVCLVHDPALLVLDEPTVGLDLESRQQIWNLLISLRNRGRTLLLTTHYLEEAETLCSRIGILLNGRLAAEGTLEELRRRISAVEVAGIECEEPTVLRARAEALGLAWRPAGQRTAVWLQERETLEAVASRFQGLPIRGLDLHPVRLEDVYQEVVGRAWTGPSVLLAPSAGDVRRDPEVDRGP